MVYQLEEQIERSNKSDKYVCLRSWRGLQRGRAASSIMKPLHASLRYMAASLLLPLHWRAKSALLGGHLPTPAYPHKAYRRSHYCECSSPILTHYQPLPKHHPSVTYIRGKPVVSSTIFALVVQVSRYWDELHVNSLDDKVNDWCDCSIV